MSLGDIICELRKERNISQKKLANSIGISQAAIAKIEINRNEATAETIRKLVTFFEVSADYLLGLEDDFGTPTTAPISDAFSREERDIIEQYRSLPDKLKKLVRDQLKVFTEAENITVNTKD